MHQSANSVEDNLRGPPAPIGGVEVVGPVSREARWVAFMACGIVWTVYTVLVGYFELGMIGRVIWFGCIEASIVAGARMSRVGAARTWGLVAVPVLAPVVWVGFFVIASAGMMSDVLAAQGGDMSRLSERLERMGAGGMLAEMLGIGFLVPALVVVTAIAVLARRAALGVGLVVVWGAVGGLVVAFVHARAQKGDSSVSPEEVGVWPSVVYVVACWATAALWFVFTPPRGDGAARSAG